MYATRGQDVMSFAGVMEPAGRDSAPVTKPGGELTAQSGDARGLIRAVQARATAPWWTKPVTVTPTGRGRAVTYQIALGPQTVTSEVIVMLKITSHPDVSTALCPWGQPVSTPVFTAMSFLPSARAVSASPATQTQAVKPSALDMAAVTTRLVFVKLATKATSVKIWIVQVSRTVRTGATVC